MNRFMDKYFILGMQLTGIIMLCIPVNCLALDKEARQQIKTEAVAEQVEKDAECKEHKEGRKGDLVEDETRVKVDKSGEPVIEQKGEASFYGKGFHGKKTASGERFNQHEKTAAHPTLPLGSEAEVTNLETGKSVEVEITDRGPYVKGRDLDLSKRAAKDIGLNKKGVAPVEIEAKIPPNAKVKEASSKCRKK